MSAPPADRPSTKDADIQAPSHEGLSVEEYVKLEVGITFSDESMPPAMFEDFTKLIRWMPVAEIILTHIPPTHDVGTAIIIHSNTFPSWPEEDLIAVMVGALAGREVRVVSTRPEMAAKGERVEGRSEYGRIRWKSSATLSAAAAELKKVDLIVMLAGSVLDGVSVGQIAGALGSPECSRGVAVILQPIAGVVPVSKMFEARGVKLAKLTEAVVSRGYAKITLSDTQLGVVTCLGREKTRE